MLCLHGKTNPGWITAALENIPAILADHAHCEKKAAATGMSLLAGYPDKQELIFAMADLVTEEIDHFRSVAELLAKKGIGLHRDCGDEYAKELISHVAKNEPDRLLDRLLTAGIIEARSCERLQILAEHLPEKDLAEFYRNLAHTEAGHYVMFTKLAKLYFPEKLVKDRLEVLCAIEQNIVNNLSNKPTMHG